METTIRKKLKAKIMYKAFQKEGLIRYFNSNVGEEEFDINDTYTFEIVIRHNENEDPNEILNNTIKKLTNN